MQIVMIAGSGQNGKTTLVKELLKIANEESVDASAFFSVTRKTFERLGLTTEKAGLLKRADEQWDLQQETFSDYMKYADEAIAKAEADGVKILFCDRSPLDYAGYVFQAIPSLNKEQVLTRVERAYDWLDGIRKKHLLNIYSLPHECPWPVEDDGYREATYCKNMVWSFIVEHLMEGYVFSRVKREIVVRHLNARHLVGLAEPRHLDTSEKRAILLWDNLAKPF